ncbi:hypothetical protein BO71DRAFT_18270 [Aspergillus ellipticus CBS 707.79]|uniref:Uncharacterized protein n=1 Tax=Aspergillus ellipticus CBS 707.79 TaxID=1448320 RepID=A0A319D696_9EURO|nr:hypothetical protein BO71DRAFT_18270 [Aspergillus ellipticus CBS 707.79]
MVRPAHPTPTVSEARLEQRATNHRPQSLTTEHDLPAPYPPRVATLDSSTRPLSAPHSPVQPRGQTSSNMNGNRNALATAAPETEHRVIVTEFVDILAYTAKCDVCNNNNKTGLTRCEPCGWQSCHECTISNGCNRSHRASGDKHIAPIDRSQLEFRRPPTETGQRRRRQQNMNGATQVNLSQTRNHCAEDEGSNSVTQTQSSQTRRGHASDEEMIDVAQAGPSQTTRRARREGTNVVTQIDPGQTRRVAPSNSVTQDRPSGLPHRTRNEVIPGVTQAESNPPRSVHTRDRTQETTTRRDRSSTSGNNTTRSSATPPSTDGSRNPGPTISTAELASGDTCESESVLDAAEGLCALSLEAFATQDYGQSSCQAIESQVADVPR